MCIKLVDRKTPCRISLLLSRLTCLPSFVCAPHVLQRPDEDLLGLVLQVVLSCLMCVLGFKTGLSIRALSALNHQPSSPYFFSPVRTTLLKLKIKNSEKVHQFIGASFLPVYKPVSHFKLAVNINFLYFNSCAKRFFSSQLSIADV